MDVLIILVKLVDRSVSFISHEEKLFFYGYTLLNAQYVCRREG